MVWSIRNSISNSLGEPGCQTTITAVFVSRFSMNSEGGRDCVRVDGFDTTTDPCRALSSTGPSMSTGQA